MKQVLKLLLVLVAFLMTNIAAAQKGDYEVNVRNANVRAIPSTKSAIVGSLSAGTVVKVKAIENGWASFNYQGKTCYVSARLLKAANAQATQKEEGTMPSSAQAMSMPQNKRQPAVKAYSSQAKARSQNKDRKALWRFDISAMPQGGLSDYGYSSVINVSAMLGGDFPVKWFGNSCTIETGVRYLYRKAFVNKNGDLMTDNNYIEIPVRLAYDLQLSKNLSLRMGAGPYLSYGLSNGVGLSAGVEPAISLKYKNFSAGVQYSASLASGKISSKSNVVMVNLAIRFGGKAWTSIGKGVHAVGNVSEAILESGLLNGNSGDRQYSRDDGNEDEDGTDEGTIYIPNQIKLLQSYIDECRENEMLNERARAAGKVRNAKGQLVGEAGSYNGVIMDYQKIIDWLNEKMRNGKKYVSKEEYQKFKDKQRDKREKKLKKTIERIKKNGERRRKIFEQHSNL